MRIFLSLILLMSIPLCASESTPPWYTYDDNTLSNQMYHGSSLLEIKQAYESAPAMIKGAVNHLKDPLHYKPNGAPEYRALMLYGEPGTGKSTLAKAIGLYANWDVEFTTPADYQVGNRNDAAQKLREKIETIMSNGVPTVLVIDEINQLLENYNSDKHDNDATSKELWTSMDKSYGNTNFFLIGTANRLYKTPQQVKSRIKARTCKIEMPKDIEGKYKIFTNVLSRQSLTLNSDGEKAVKNALTKHKEWSGRDYSELIFNVRQVLTDEWGVTIKNGEQLGSKIINECVKNMEQTEQDLEWGTEEMTDDERQDLYQGLNTLTQVMIQRFQKLAIPGRAPGLNREDGNYILDQVTTQSIKRLLKKNIDLDEIKKARY